VPVTAKLSRKFYERFGDEIATELVDWFNQVDATYRADLHQLNELNFGRFDAKLEQRVTELDAKFAQRLGELDAKIERRIAEVRGELRSGLAGVEIKLTRLRAELVKWMFVFWLGTVGLALAIARLV
jgi:ABC-type phosphate transport system auxiliary subunit